jgi:indolepyruvate ferredoxin oxidoreductase, beta subunit
VPGLAQRTGATIYYLEFYPRAAAEAAGREPVMALMPVAGDVDCVVASELVEAGRAIQRGLVSQDRTTLIASTHRSYAIVEKSAMGHGPTDADELMALVRQQGKRVILFDMDATAERHHAVISAVLLGSICGAGVLPFPKQAFMDAITHGGLAVKTNLAAFEDACQQAQRGGSQVPAHAAGAPLPAVPAQARTPRLQPLLERVHRLPPALQPLVLEGVRRTLDYQDADYAALYLARVESVAALETGGSTALAEATARGLALWMSFEDTIRVAQLKTRGSRFERVREEIRATPGQLFGITEFMKPRVAEIAGTMPAAMGAWVLKSPAAQRLLG